MLRVRPVHYTSHPQEFKRLLTALGMAVTADYGTWIELDAGHGRLALHAMPAASTGDATTALGFEARDLETFRQRTEDAGSHAVPFSADHGANVKVIPPDGLEFVVDRANESAHEHDADQALAVVAVWLTPDVAGAAKVLADMGARERSRTEDAADFTAKNGGVVHVRHAREPDADLAFEYDGDLQVLHGKLAGAGLQPSLADTPAGPVLEVPDPDGPDSPSGGKLRITRPR
ncbi:hypothetical protein D477_016275 [Arthrobacter crystallopoietes BAB-32]|uniref:VOC domain-containing protein n=1 Tax=Arthrobacter crystallopoietes BAB-32 TaxID=1246476 RepID=N1V4K1_9MICC|nr:hypothetical protein [Arthrobacter crystallopoietes]EMY33173.1 hypothetical protein D477_016275 [Arthrobacter crystallopoietes BAB-32]